MRKVQILMLIRDLIVHIYLLQNFKEKSTLTGLCRDVYRQPSARENVRKALNSYKALINNKEYIYGSLEFWVEPGEV